MLALEFSLDLCCDFRGDLGGELSDLSFLDLLAGAASRGRTARRASRARRRRAGGGASRRVWLA